MWICGFRMCLFGIGENSLTPLKDTDCVILAFCHSGSTLKVLALLGKAQRRQGINVEQYKSLVCVSVSLADQV